MSDDCAVSSYDILVIGGGVNGCGIARDAAGRGYSVFLAEMNDLASGTSSGSTKLIHGGLRYLEHYEFRLVREALAEREVLWANAPHIIWPLRFVLPHHRGLRPAWLLRLGLFLYDHIGGRKALPRTRVIDLRQDVAGTPLKADYIRAFEYSDCWVDDARLVVLNARDAADRGAQIATRTKVVGVERAGEHWKVALRDEMSGANRDIRCRLLVNAAGPWVDEVLRATSGRNDIHHLRLVQGSHIVVRRLFEHDRCYIFQNADGRIIFAIPYEEDFTLIGTTDQDYRGEPIAARISPAEIDYLCAAVSGYFRQPISREDIVWTYSAVRSLYDDGTSAAQEATRDYVLKIDGEAGDPRIINVFGGKITTYRRLAEAALDHVEDILGKRGKAWTSSAALPGGDFPFAGFGDLVTDLAARYPGIGQKLLHRLARHYGTRARLILGQARTETELGRAFGAGLSEAELRYLVNEEWAMTAEDVLWRRSKLGLQMSAEEISALEAWLASELGPRVIGHTSEKTPG